MRILRGMIMAILVLAVAMTAAFAQDSVSDVGFDPTNPISGGYAELPHPVPGWEFPIVTVAPFT